MPKTAKGKKVYRSMKKTYGSPEKAKQVFYASENKGTITGVHKKGARRGKKASKK